MHSSHQVHGSSFAEYINACTIRGMSMPTTVDSLDALARFGHALSDPTRARILMRLRDSSDYPADLADLLGVTRQSMSNHLACLRGCGLVVAIPEGRRNRYELADPRLAHALEDLHQVILATDPDLCVSGATGESV